MQKTQRRFHRVIWLALTPLLVFVLYQVGVSRLPMPVEAEPAAATARNLLP